MTMNSEHLPKFTWHVSMTDRREDEDHAATLQVQAPHRSGAKARASEEVEWNPTWWYAWTENYFDRMKTEEQRQKEQEVMSDLWDAMLLAVVVTVTMPLWYPILRIAELLGFDIAPDTDATT